jgi:acetyl esterase/lipase
MEDKTKENKIEEESPGYTLSNENIKFPIFLDEELNSYYKKEGMTKEILIEDLSKIKENIKSITDILTDLTKSNKNEFNTLCLKYNINSYDFIVSYKLIEELASSILSKIQGNSPQNSQLTLEDFFPKESNDNNKEICEIIKSQYVNVDKDYSNIKARISLSLEEIKYINETNVDYGIPFLCYLLKYYLNFINKSKTQLDTYAAIENFKNNDIKIFRKNMIVYFDLIFMLQKLVVGDSILYNGYLNDKNDIFNFEENSKEWENLKKIMFRVNSKDLEKVKEEYKKANDGMNNMTIFMDKVNFNSNMFVNATKVVGTAIKYKMNSDENLRIYETKENRLLSNKVLIEEGLKMVKIKVIKNRMMKSFPPIKLREKVYMKKECPEITLDYIKSLLMKIYDQDTILKNFGDTKQPERELLDENIKAQLPLWTTKPKKEEKKYFVSSRLFSNSNLNLNKKTEEKKSFFNFFSKGKNTDTNKSPENKPNCLLIHVHGGGFLESSNFISEKYLREASCVCNIPVIGLNYGCAPKHKYPEGLNDCFQGYMWILNHCENELGIKPEKILLSGDSAGGSLILGLTLLIISMNKFDDKKIKVPDILFGLYPCCTLDHSAITLSSCIAFDNILLSLKDTGYMRTAYRGYYENELDPYINQMKSDEKLLENFPITRFLTATNDGLRDEAIRFANKISKIEGNDVKVYDFTYFEHGFMGNDSVTIRGPPHSIYFKEINEFINKNKNN